MGLVVAIPGVIAGRLLDRKQNSLEDDLDQMVALATLQRNEVSP
jgi:biopolymer transport protein ExbB/TolQ